MFKWNQKKKYLSILLAIVMLLSCMGCNQLSKGGKQVLAAEFRQGYSLQPTKIDKTGLYTDSAFILSADQEELATEYIEKGFEISNDIPFSVAIVEGQFVITPEVELERDMIYTFSYGQASWTYQTIKAFGVLGFLPAHQSSFVPVDSGIEVYFTHENVDMEDYFEIIPSVKGTFENHGRVSVFVPEALEEGTLYTVTIQKGLSVQGSNQRLEKAYSFQFETEPKNENQTKNEYHISFESFLYDLTSEERGELGLSVYSEKSQEAVVNGTIYRYEDTTRFEKHLKQFLELPNWIASGIDLDEINLDGLKKVIEFEQRFDMSHYNKRSLKLPIQLEPGLYIVEADLDGANTKTLVQVADFSYSYAQMNNEDIVWVVDLVNDIPLEGAIITQDDIYKKTDQDGIAKIKVSYSDEKYYHINQIKYNNQLLYNVTYKPYNEQGVDYWRYFETDRNLYKPNDRINFFGFIQSRDGEKINDKVSVELSANNWWYYDTMSFMNQEMPYEVEEVSIEDGFFSGELTIPNLPPEYYQLTVKLGDDVIATQYIDVENYEKPDYKIEIEKDKNAVFLGEPIEFKVKSAFYEGTKVANIPITININGLEYKQQQVISDEKGDAIYTYIPTGSTDPERGMANGYIGIRGTFPESGDVYVEDYFEIFTKDIYLDIETEIEANKGTINLSLNHITLDKINNPSNEEEVINRYGYYDNAIYIGEPVNEGLVDLIIYKNIWNKEEVGTEYDFVNKVTRKRYNYNLETTIYKEISTHTDESGKSSLEVDLETIKENGYYSIVANTRDKENRLVTVNRGFYEGYDYYPNDYDYYEMVLDQQAYSIDDTVQIEYKNSNDKVLEGYFLYIFDTIKGAEVTVKNEPVTTVTFTEDYMPNVMINGTWFNGDRLETANANTINFDYNDNEMKIEVTTNKEQYKPGDICQIDIKATYYDQIEGVYKPVQDGLVNISVVDEALFGLSEHSVDVLKELYTFRNGRYTQIFNSHSGIGHNYYYGGARSKFDLGFSEGAGMVKAEMAKDSDSPIPTLDMNVTATVRSDFRDTSIFETIALDEGGKGSIKYELPQNVTSWRMVLSGISNELKAGNEISEVIVTLPYFINSNMNKTYLVGDKPSIGISSYGNSISSENLMSYKVYCKETDFETVVTGEAFERVNVPLWELEKGDYHVIVEGYTDNGYSDGLETIIHVVDSFYEIEAVNRYDAGAELRLSNNSSGMTEVSFVDTSKGKFIRDLYRLSYYGGKRVDQKVTANVAEMTLIEQFGKASLMNDEVNIVDYIQDNGLLSILPYSEGDIQTTISMLPIIKETTDLTKIRLVFEANLYNKEITDRAKILYGLALLNENVLLEVNNLNETNNLSFEDRLYVALSYTALSDNYMANEIFEQEVMPYVKAYDAMNVVEFGDNKDDYLYYTSLVTLLASQLDREDKDNYYNYVLDHMYSKEILVNPYMLTYIINELDKLISFDETSIQYKYDGKTYTKKLTNGYSQTINIPSAKLDQFEIMNVEGNIDVITINLEPMVDEVKRDDHIKVTKTITSVNGDRETIKEGDIVKVVIHYEIDEEAIDDYYTITDYAPSGLVPIEIKYNRSNYGDGSYYYYDTDGQKVTFYVHKNNKDKIVQYFARIVSLGEYTAEGPVIQGTRVKDSLNVGEDVSVVIE